MAFVAMLLCTSSAWAETLYFAFGGGTVSNALVGDTETAESPGNETWTSTEHAGYSWAITGNPTKSISGGNKVNATPYYDGYLTGFKNSNGAQNTFYMPEGVKISNIKFIGYTNKAKADGKTCTLQEINGVTVTENNTLDVYTDDVVNKQVENPGVIDYTFPEPVSGSFTFKMGSQQGCFIIVIETVEEEIPAEPTSETVLINFAADGNCTATSGTFGDISFATDKGTASNAPAYNTNSAELRVYRYTNLNFTSQEYVINKIVITCSSAGYMGGDAIEVTAGENAGTATAVAAENVVKDEEDLTYTITVDEANYVNLANLGSENVQLRIKSIEVTYAKATKVKVGAPDFSVAAGNLFAAASLELTAEDGATLYWSTDNENFVAYTGAIAIESSCTIYAYAEKDGIKSVVASVDYVVAATYDNVAALLAAEATSDGVPVVVKLEATVDSLAKNSVFLVEGDNTLMVYDYNIPADYVVGNKVKGQLAGLWKDYKGTLELCNVDYSGATVVAPVTVESPWVGAVAEAGTTYYFYNPEAKAFLKAGNSWGTRASFGQDAYPIILEGADNVYALSTTLTFAGKGLRSSDLFMDQSLDKFTFEEVGNGIYTFSYDGKYVAYTGVNTVEYAAELNEGCYWQLLTADAIKEQMLVADENNPLDVTALIPGANFGRNNAQNSAWVTENVANYSNAGGANNGDNNNQQVWNAGLSKISQAITGLPNGTYLLNAQAFYRMGGVAEAAAARTAGTEIYDVKLFANTDSVMVMSVMEEAGKLDVGSNYDGFGKAPDNQTQARDYFTAGYYDHAIYFTVTDGTANIGVVKNSSVGYDWLVFDNFRLTYYGTATVSEINKVRFFEVKNELDMLMNSCMSLYALGAVNNAYMAVSDSAFAIANDENATPEVINAYIPVMEAKIAEVKAIDEYYNNVFTPINDLCYETQQNSTPNSDEVYAAFDEVCALAGFMNLYSNVASIEDLKVLADTLEDARRIYVVNAVPTEGFAFDYTFLAVNPDMADGTINGWTATDGWQFQSNAIYTGEGAELNRFQERWQGGSGLGNTSTMQTLSNLPNGVYRISADIMATAQYDADPKGHTTGAYWVANSDSVAVATENNKPERFTVEATVVDGNLTFGLVGVNTTANWIGLDNVTIEFCEATTTDPLAEKKAAFIEKKNAFDLYSQESLNYAWNMINNNYFWPVSDAVYALADTLDKVTDVTVIDQAIADMDNAIVMVEKAYVVGDRYNYFKGLLWYASDNTTPANDEAAMALAMVLENSNYASYTISTVEALEAATTELKDAYLAYIPNAWGNQEGVTFDVTFMAGLTPRAGDSYDAATDAWSASGTSANAPEVTTADGRTAPMIEYNTRVGKEKLNSVVMQQTVWNLPNGTYNVELYANALNNNYEVALTDGDNTLVYVSANDVKTPVVAKNATAITESEVYAINGAVVTDGSLHLTLSKNDKDGTNWHTVQVKSISLVAPVKVAAGKKVVYDLDVEREAGLGYTAEDYTIATSELAALLGVESLGEATIWGVNPDGSYVADAMNTYDGWRAVDGTFAGWSSETAAVCVKLYAEEAAYLISICTHADNGNDPVAGTQSTAVWALVAGVDTVVINTNITFTEPAVVNIADFEVVSTIKVEHNETVGVAFSGNTASFDAAAVAAALGVTSLADAEQYILNVTTGNLVANSTDGWRNSQGDATAWGSLDEGSVCVKINNPASGTIDYIGCYDTTFEAGEVYTAKWAFVHEGKAVVIEVVITFIPADGIDNLLNPDAPITVYTINGKAIQTTVGGVKSLEKGIYIINGVKTLVK